MVTQRQRYVVGFTFARRGEWVALIYKISGPKCVIDRLNGIGGKVEPGETSLEAMVREHEEETGQRTQPEDWKSFGVYRIFNDGLVPVSYIEFFVRHQPLLGGIETVTAEKVDWYRVEDLAKLHVVENLRWLIPIALNPDISITVVETPGSASVEKIGKTPCGQSPVGLYLIPANGKVNSKS